VQHIQELVSITNKAIAFMWVLSHVGISGSKTADKFTNEATLLHNTLELNPTTSSEPPLILKFRIHGRNA